MHWFNANVFSAAKLRFNYFTLAASRHLLLNDKHKPFKIMFLFKGLKKILWQGIGFKYNILTHSKGVKKL
jgi:hypothetical protein